MPEQNSIVENWIVENESKLKQISVENKPLYESVFLALEYLNNSLGGKVITAPKVEAEIITEPEKIVYLTNGVRKDVIQIGSVGMILSESENLYRIAWFKDEYEQYDGEYDKTMFTDVNPEFKVSDKVEFPTTQFGSKLGEGLQNIIQEAKNNNVSWLWITDLEYNAFNDNKWVYWLTFDMVNKYGVSIEDLKKSTFEQGTTKVKKPKTSNPRTNYKKVYLKENLSSSIGNNISVGSLGMVLDDSNDKYLIAWDKSEYDVYNGKYKKEMFTDVDPIFSVGDKVGFPTTQFQTPLGLPAMAMITEAEKKGYTTLKIVDMVFDFLKDNKWKYGTTNEIRERNIGFNLEDLTKAKSVQGTITVKAEKTKKPRLKYKIGQEVISKADPTSIYEIIDLINAKSTLPNYKLSSKTDVTKLDFWIYDIDLEKDYNISQKKSISLPIKQETQTQQAEFEDLADELDNLEI